jgi:hypothetical protein
MKGEGPLPKGVSDFGTRVSRMTGCISSIGFSHRSTGGFQTRVLMRVYVWSWPISSIIDCDWRWTYWNEVMVGRKKLKFKYLGLHWRVVVWQRLGVIRRWSWWWWWWWWRRFWCWYLCQKHDGVLCEHWSMCSSQQQHCTTQGIRIETDWYSAHLHMSWELTTEWWREENACRHYLVAPFNYCGWCCWMRNTCVVAVFLHYKSQYHLLEGNWSPALQLCNPSVLLCVSHFVISVRPLNPPIYTHTEKHCTTLGVHYDTVLCLLKENTLSRFVGKT